MDKLLICLLIFAVGAESCAVTPQRAQALALQAPAASPQDEQPPAFLVEGAKGSGEWLSRIKPRPTNFEASSILKALAQDYIKGKLLNSSDTYLKFAQLLLKYDYPVEEYEVKTEDGYLLTLFRIPHSKKSPVKPGVNKPVVFLMHGLIDSSDNWIISGPEKGLAYILADAGYDVWLGNARGNSHSKKHITMKPDDAEFWDFSWDEIGRYDLPAMIDFALNKTKETKLYYIGHSQGTTSFFVMCSMKPEYNKKIRIMFALAPVAYMSNAISPLIRLVAPLSKGLDWVARVLGVGEFLPNSQVLSTASGFLCSKRAITKDLCSNALFIVTGFDVEQLNATMLPVYMGHVPAGSSVRQFLHYGQGVTSGEFRRYDYGSESNTVVYGSDTPPKYDVAKITCPVSLFYSENDWLSHPNDVDILAKQLGNRVDTYKVPNPNFNHMDYIWAIKAAEIVYDRILKMLPNY